MTSAACKRSWWKIWIWKQKDEKMFTWKTNAESINRRNSERMGYIDLSKKQGENTVQWPHKQKHVSNSQKQIYLYGQTICSQTHGFYRGSFTHADERLGLLGEQVSCGVSVRLDNGKVWNPLKPKSHVSFAVSDCVIEWSDWGLWLLKYCILQKFLP